MTAVSLLVFLTSYASIELTRQSGRIARVWFTNALLLCLVLKSPRKLWLSWLVCGLITRLNAAWEGVLGYPVADWIGKPFLDFVHPEDQAATVAAMSRLAASRDISVRKESERHLKEVLAAIAHQWRQPLNAGRRLPGSAQRDRSGPIGGQSQPVDSEDVLHHQRLFQFLCRCRSNRTRPGLTEEAPVEGRIARFTSSWRIQVGNNCRFGFHSLLHGGEDVNSSPKEVTLLGNDVQVGSRAVVFRSTLGDRCSVGEGALVDGCLLVAGDSVPPRTIMIKNVVQGLVEW